MVPRLLTFIIKFDWFVSVLLFEQFATDSNLEITPGLLYFTTIILLEDVLLFSPKSFPA